MDKIDFKNEAFRSWFCVFNNPEEHGYTGEPQTICDNIVDDWVNGSPTRSCAVCYCVSADGLKHLHVVLEDTKKLRFSAVKNCFPSMHIEPTKGSKEQAEDYINKKGKFAEKGEIILATARHGEIKGRQGQRKDLEIISDLIEQGKTPTEIFEMDFSYRKYERIIKQAYTDKRRKETPVHRPVTVYWHTGRSGSGKTYTYVQLCEKYGEDNVFFVNDISDRGAFDEYSGQKYLCIDELRGGDYAKILNLLGDYKMPLACRYQNSVALWGEVHIFSILDPKQCYDQMVLYERRNIDPYEQLKRRINFVVYHFKNEYGVYGEITVPMDTYKDTMTIINSKEFAREYDRRPFESEEFENEDEWIQFAM